jgi:multiple sugar transport system permease protein
MMRKKRTHRFFTLYIPVFVLLALTLIPFIWIFLTSLKNPNELYSKVFTYLPVQPTLNNYAELFTKTNFIQNIKNSILVAGCTSLISLLIATMSAYAFTRYRFRGRKLLLGSYLLIYMFPAVLFLIPLFMEMRKFGLINTLWALIIAHSTFTIPLSVWLMVGFLNEVPIEIEESALVDGCNRFVSFIKIVFPIISPGLAATGSYIFIYSWNEFLYAVMFTNEATRTLPVALQVFVGQYLIQWDLLSAGAVVTVIPVILLFMLIQKNLVRGLTAGAVKG